MAYRNISRKALYTAGIILFLLWTFFSASSASAGNSVTHITLNPATPNILTDQEKVSIAFSYTTTQPEGVRIFARPFVGTTPAPGYAASPAPISPVGSGSGTQFFTLSSGNVTVNRIRFQMFNAAQTKLLFEAYLPVSYEFRAP